jgi:uncharacterized membrane protein
MKTIKNDWLIWLMLLAPFIFLVLYWEKFPDQIATHFDLEGNPNDYSGKTFGLLFEPLMNIGLYFLFIVLPKIDPKRANYALFSDKYRIIRIAMHAFIAGMCFLNAFYSLGYHFNMGMIVMYSVMLLMLVLGNYMGNIRPNYFVGIRVPWTLASEEVWTKTHRLAGKLWVFSTLLMFALIPFLPFTEYFFVAYITIITLIPIIYSYIVFKKITTHEH